MKTNWIISSLLVLLATGCSPSAVTDPSGLLGPPVQAGPTESAPDPVGGLAAHAQDWLAEDLAVPPESIRLVSAEVVTWPNPSLGCPVLGVLYANVETPGYILVFETDGARYELHSDLKGRVVECDLGGPIQPPAEATPGGIQDNRPWMPVEPIEPGATPPSR